MSVFALAFRPDGKRLAVGVHGQALLYDTERWAVAEAFVGVYGAVRALTYHPDGKRLALGSGNPGQSGNLALWDPDASFQTRHYQAAGDTIEGIAFSKDGANLLTAASDNKARFYPVALYAYGSERLEEHNGRVTAVAFSPKPGTVFVTGALDKMAKVWDLRSLKVVVNFDQASAGLSGVTFLNNGDQFVGASLDGNLYWWGFGYNERRRTYSGYHFRTARAHEDGVLALGASLNRQRMVTGGKDKRVRIWRVDDGALLREMREPTAPIYAAALSADGARAAAAGRDGQVWVWDTDSGKLVATLTPPQRP